MAAEAKTPLSYSTFMQQVDKGRIAPCYFFYGPEDVLAERALLKLKEAAIESGTVDFNWAVYRADSDDINWVSYADALTSLPLLAARRVVVLKGAGKAGQNKIIAGLIERSIQAPAADLILVFIDENPDLRRAFIKKLLDHCVPVAFTPPKAQELQIHLRDFAADFGKSLSDRALERMLVESSPSLRDLLSKLEVLIFFSGDKKQIDAADVEECSSFSREVEIYSLLDALGRRDGAQAHLLLERLLHSRLELGALIFNLHRQIWALYRMKYLQEKKVPAQQWQERLDLKPAFLEKRYRDYLPKFSRQELGRSLEVLAKIDLDRKTLAVEDAALAWILIETLLHPEQI